MLFVFSVVNPNNLSQTLLAKFCLNLYKTGILARQDVILNTFVKIKRCFWRLFPFSVKNLVLIFRKPD